MFSKRARTRIGRRLATIAAVAPAQSHLSKEFVYFGDRLIAVEVPSSEGAGGEVVLAIHPIPAAPGGVALAGGGSHAFEASVTGTTNQGVTWSIASGAGCLAEGAQCGATSAENPVTFRAPSSIASASTTTLRVTSVADPLRTADVVIALTPFTIAIEPVTSPVGPAGSVALNLVVTGFSPSSEQWATLPGEIGSFPNPAVGTYQAPTCVPGGVASASVRVVLDGDPLKTAATSIPLTPGGDCGGPPLGPGELALTHLTMQPDDILRRGVTQVGISYTVQATGQQADNAVLQFWLSGSANSTSGDLVHSVNLGGLSSTSVSGSTDFVVPAGATQDLTRWLVGRVSFPGEIADADNIRSAGPVQVLEPLPGSGGVPDLIPNSIVFTPTVTTAEVPVIWGGTGNIGGDLNKTGAEDPEVLQMRVEILASPVHLQSWTVPAFLPGPYSGNPLPTWMQVGAWSPIPTPGSAAYARR